MAAQEDKDENLIAHLEALRSMLVRCLTAMALVLPPMFLIAPYFLDWLIRTIIAEAPVTLNFFLRLRFLFCKSNWPSFWIWQFVFRTLPDKFGILFCRRFMTTSGVLSVPSF